MGTIKQMIKSREAQREKLGKEIKELKARGRNLLEEIQAEEYPEFNSHSGNTTIEKIRNYYRSVDSAHVKDCAQALSMDIQKVRSNLYQAAIRGEVKKLGKGVFTIA